MGLRGKFVLITGAAVRVGRAMAFAAAEAGANVIIHFDTSAEEAKITQSEIQAKGVEAHLLQADLNSLESVPEMIEESYKYGPLYALMNNAAKFESLTLFDTDIPSWNQHMNVNLTSPFLLSQAFASQLGEKEHGRIVNILDWRALRPGADHLPYTISKASLAALTRSMAIALAPNITVNGIAFGAILPPIDDGDIEHILKDVPANRWATLDEVGKTLLFLLDGPAYITGEIIHLDGGRQLV
jgi:NAD(P)-dependent dehydrogenase (short-subunit alcohol dehydrogenase family)